MTPPPGEDSAETIRHVFRWDLDKTYLRTDFDSLSSLLRIPFEKARDKVNVPGAAPLLRALSHPPDELGPVDVHFISGSPRQMRKVLERKLSLDGVRYASLHLKPNLENLARGRFRAIKEQVGYKLPLLLTGRGPYGPAAAETLFGDDAESDAYIYSLYADFLGGRVEWEIVEAVLAECGVYPDTVEEARRARDGLTRVDCVEGIFINLDRRSSPARFAALSERIVPTYNWWQAALCLQARGRLSAEGTLAVAREMVESFGYTVPRLRNSAEDLIRRGLWREEELAAVMAGLGRASPEWDARPLVDALSRLEGVPQPAQDGEDRPPRDYLALLREERVARERVKAADIALRRRLAGPDREEG